MLSKKRLREDPETSSDEEINSSSVESDSVEEEISDEDGSETETRVKRKKNQNSVQDDSEDENDDGEDDLNSDDDISENDGSDEDNEDDEVENSDNEEGDDDDDDDDEEGDDDDDHGDDDSDASNDTDEELDEEGSGKGSDSEAENEDDIETGNGIIAQSKLYNGLLACRMKAQEALTAMNQLPQGENFECITSSGSEFEDAMNNTKRTITKALSCLVRLQSELLTCRGDTRFVADVTLTPEEDDKGIDTEGDEQLPLAGKRKISDYPEFLSKRQKLLNEFRDDVLEKVNNSVALLPVQSSFSNFESSALNQIQQILLDKERLVRRTQLIRSSLPIIGKQDIEEELDQKSSRKQRYDVEIFDDSDFYNKLLTQQIYLKTSNMMDLSAVTKEWAEFHKLKQNKAVVDRKVSKGRKIRYTTHRKLINFMMPLTTETMVYSDEQRDALAHEIFRSLD